MTSVTSLRSSSVAHTDICTFQYDRKPELQALNLSPARLLYGLGLRLKRRDLMV